MTIEEKNGGGAGGGGADDERSIDRHQAQPTASFATVFPSMMTSSSSSSSSRVEAMGASSGADNAAMIGGGGGSEGWVKQFDVLGVLEALSLGLQDRMVSQPSYKQQPCMCTIYILIVYIASFIYFRKSLGAY